MPDEPAANVCKVRLRNAAFRLAARGTLSRCAKTGEGNDAVMRILIREGLISK